MDYSLAASPEIFVNTSLVPVSLRPSASFADDGVNNLQRPEVDNEEAPKMERSLVVQQLTIGVICDSGTKNIIGSIG